RFEESARYFGKAASLAPNFPEAYFALAELARRRGKDEEAIAAFRKAVTLRPDYAGALLPLAESYRRRADLQQAKEALLQAARTDPGNPRYHLLLSQIY